MPHTHDDSATFLYSETVDQPESPLHITTVARPNRVCCWMALLLRLIDPRFAHTKITSTVPSKGNGWKR